MFRRHFEPFRRLSKLLQRVLKVVFQAFSKLFTGLFKSLKIFERPFLLRPFKGFEGVPGVSGEGQGKG